MREYKVVEVKKKGFLGASRLTAEDIEDLLNREAQAGWVFDKHLESETLILDKETIMFVFYREKR
jgi:hypothetical protein